MNDPLDGRTPKFEQLEWPKIAVVLLGGLAVVLLIVSLTTPRKPKAAGWTGGERRVPPVKPTPAPKAKAPEPDPVPDPAPVAEEEPDS